MTTLEKAFGIFSIVFAVSLTFALWYYPSLRQLPTLLPLSFVGLLINIAFMFLILRHILTNNSFPKKTKYIWVAAVLLFWPAAIIYFFSHGFSKESRLTA